MEKKLVCPNCGEPFEIDEKGYAAIAKQVRDKEFKEELSRQQASFESEKKTALPSCPLISRKFNGIYMKTASLWIHRSLLLNIFSPVTETRTNICWTAIRNSVLMYRKKLLRDFS